MSLPPEIARLRTGQQAQAQARWAEGVGLRAWFSDLWLVWTVMLWLTAGFGIHRQPEAPSGWLSFAEGLWLVLSAWHTLGFWRRRRRFQLRLRTAEDGGVTQG